MRKSARKYYGPLAALAELAKEAGRVGPEYLDLADEYKGKLQVASLDNLGWAGFSGLSADDSAEFLSKRNRLLVPCAKLARRALGHGLLGPFRAFYVGIQVHQALRRLARNETTAELGVIGVTLTRGPDGRIVARRDTTPDEVQQIFAGREISRLAVCPVCDEVFVRVRLDQSAHSGRCTATLNVRRLRAREKAKASRARKNPPALTVIQGKGRSKARGATTAVRKRISK